VEEDDAATCRYNSPKTADMPTSFAPFAMPKRILVHETAEFRLRTLSYAHVAQANYCMWL
jgi:hypothetical protein